MNARTLRYLISALFVLGLGIYFLLTYTATMSYQETFNLTPGYIYSYSTTRNPSDVVTGQFQETSGNPISFYIETSAQFASFQTGTFTGSVYSIENVPSGTFSFTIPTQDTYHLLFRHGTGLTNTTETVYFQRSYQTQSTYRLIVGIAFIGVAAFDLYLAYRTGRTRPPTAQPAAGSTNPPIPSPPFQLFLEKSHTPGLRDT